MLDTKTKPEITPEILEQARQYIEVGLDYLIKNDPGYDMLYTAAYWTYMNLLIITDMVDLIYKAHGNHIKSLRFDKNTVLSNLGNIPYVSIKDFFTYMRKIDDMSRRDVMDCIEGLGLATKERLYDTVINDDFHEFEKIITETNYDFVTSSKMAQGIYVYKNVCTANIQTLNSVISEENYPYLAEYVKSKFPDIERINFIPFENLNDEELRIVGKYQKWNAGHAKANLDIFLSNLPSIKRELVISKIPPKTYEAYQKIEYPEDLEIVQNLITNYDENTWILHLEQQIKNSNNGEQENISQVQHKITQIDEDKMKKVFKAIYWDGLDDNPNANVDTLVMYIKDMKSDAKTKSIDYARVAYIIFGCEYFIEENPDTGRAWTFSAWYKHFCDICDVKYNDNYKDYSNIIPENPKYIKFQRILPKRKK